MAYQTVRNIRLIEDYRDKILFYRLFFHISWCPCLQHSCFDLFCYCSYLKKEKKILNKFSNWKKVFFLHWKYFSMIFCLRKRAWAALMNFNWSRHRLCKSICLFIYLSVCRSVYPSIFIDWLWQVTVKILTWWSQTLRYWKYSVTVCVTFPKYFPILRSLIKVRIY